MHPEGKAGEFIALRMGNPPFSAFRGFVGKFSTRKDKFTKVTTPVSGLIPSVMLGTVVLSLHVVFFIEHCSFSSEMLVSCPVTVIAFKLLIGLVDIC